MMPTPAPVYFGWLLGGQADLLLHGQRAAVASACSDFDFRLPRVAESALEEALAVADQARLVDRQTRSARLRRNMRVSDAATNGST